MEWWSIELTGVRLVPHHSKTPPATVPSMGDFDELRRLYV